MRTPYLLAAAVALAAAIGGSAPVAGRAQADGAALRRDVDALNRRMVAAFKRDPASVAAFYTDSAALLGAGERHQGRAAVDAYWKGAAMFDDWTLETLEVGGPADAPWQYGRSVVHSRSGRSMETYFVALLRRQPSGELKFQVDAFVRDRQDSGGPEVERVFDAYLEAVGRRDAPALQALLDDQFAIVSGTGTRGKADEIADLVPASGARVESFRSDETRTRGFGPLAVTTGVLRWKVDGREIERNHSTIAVKRGAEWKILAQQVTPRGAPPASSGAPQPGPEPVRVRVPQVAAPASGSGVAETVANAVAERYVFPDAGAKIAEHVRERARNGAYEPLTGGELADALTQDLRAVNGDRHLYVQYQPGQTAAPGAGSPSGPMRQVAGGTPATADLMRRRNYFLNRVERLDGNIGYLDVRRFFGMTDEALAAAAGAMAFLSQTDAFIVDVRFAPGGDVRMVDMLASYFFEKVTPTLATYSRSMDRTIQRSTLEQVPGRRRPDIPVYVLISRDTGSAAEDFAFLMQQTGRAKLVGDRTAGAGHTNAILGIGGGYSVSVSIGRTFNPKTNEGWEGTGVQPDVPTPVAGALDQAHRLALSTLIDKTTDAAVRTELSWTRDAIDARLAPRTVDEKTLKSYAGQYGTRLVSFADGRLYYQRVVDSERVPMVALSPSEFALAEGQRVQFVVAGGASELRMLNPDGTKVSYSRHP